MELELLSRYLNSGKLIENNKKQPRKHKSNMQKLQEFIFYKKVIYHFCNFKVVQETVNWSSMLL